MRVTKSKLMESQINRLSKVFSREPRNALSIESSSIIIKVAFIIDIFTNAGKIRNAIRSAVMTLPNIVIVYSSKGTGKKELKRRREVNYNILVALLNCNL